MNICMLNFIQNGSDIEGGVSEEHLCGQKNLHTCNG